MRILVFESTKQLNFHIIYAICVGSSQIMMGMVFVLVLTFYTNGHANAHTHWNYSFQNTHSGYAIIGYQLLLAQGILSHNRTDNWPSSLHMYVRIAIHVLFTITGSIAHWYAVGEVENINLGGHEACGESDHCEYGWMTMYIGVTAAVFGPLAVIFNHICSIFHSFLGSLAFIWASATIITGIRADINHRELFYPTKHHQHEDMGRMGIFFIYFYTITILVSPLIKTCKFAGRICSGFKLMWKELQQKKECLNVPAETAQCTPHTNVIPK